MQFLLLLEQLSKRFITNKEQEQNKLLFANCYDIKIHALVVKTSPFLYGFRNTLN